MINNMPAAARAIDGKKKRTAVKIGQNRRHSGFLHLVAMAVIAATIRRLKARLESHNNP